MRAMSPNDKRLGGLRRFAIGISLLNLFGYTVLGFEPPLLQPLVALATAYALELGLELLDARAGERPPRFAGGLQNLIDFLLPAHITALALSMLLFANDRMLPIVFGTAVAIASKRLLRVSSASGWKHVMNPSNLGIAVVLLLFPSVGIAPPYQFTENFTGAWHWLVPAIILLTGSFLNARFSGRVPLILAWLAGFAAQAGVRAAAGAAIEPFVPMTGAAFVLFTMYMITDPSTTPFARRAQICFGLATAAVYGALMALHVAFGLFFALSAVCALRGVVLLAASLSRGRAAAQSREALAPVPAARAS
jgi:hypothetical protein